MSDPAPPEPARRLWTQRVGTVRASVTGLVGLVGAALTVLFLLVPSLKPLPRDKIGVTLAIDDIQNGVGVRQWARWQYPSGSDDRLTKLLGHRYGSIDRQGVGTVVYVRLTTVGFQHRSVRLRLQVLSARSGQESDDLDVKQQYPAAASVDVSNPSLDSVQLLYLDDLKDLVGDIVIRVVAYDGDGVLAYADSGVIRNGRIVRKWNMGG